MTKDQFKFNFPNKYTYAYTEIEDGKFKAQLYNKLLKLLLKQLFVTGIMNILKAYFLIQASAPFPLPHAPPLLQLSVFTEALRNVIEVTGTLHQPLSRKIFNSNKS